MPTNLHEWPRRSGSHHQPQPLPQHVLEHLQASAPRNHLRVPRVADYSAEGSAATDDTADFPDASAEHAPMLVHAIGWAVACITWAIGVTAAQWLFDVGAFGVPLTMAAGAAWVFASIGMKRSFVHAVQRW